MASTGNEMAYAACRVLLTRKTGSARISAEPINALAA